MTSKVSPFGARIAFVDLTTGQLTPEAFRWLVRQILERVGGTTALTNNELEAAFEAVALAPPLVDDFIASYDDALLAPPAEPLAAPDNANARLEALEAEVARLTRLIHDIQLGTQL